MAKYNLDADVQAFIDKTLGAFAEDSATQDAPEQRRRYNAMCRLFDKPRPIGLSVKDDIIPGDHGPIRIRIYTPEIDGPLGCLVYYHGGGWVVGDLDSHDSITAEIAHRAGIVVVAVDYRMAPEYQYPVGHEDCWRVLSAVETNPASFGVDPSRIAVGGDSAGANAAAGMCMRSRERGDIAIAGQVLIYGAFGGDMNVLPSYTECSDAPLLSTQDILEYRELYFPGGGFPDDTFAAPLMAVNYEGLPPAFIQPAEYDPVRDDSVEYARRLDAAGVPVELHIETGLVHGHLRSRHSTKKGAEAFTRICQAVQRMLAS